MNLSREVQAPEKTIDVGEMAQQPMEEGKLFFLPNVINSLSRDWAEQWDAGKRKSSGIRCFAADEVKRKMAL